MGQLAAMVQCWTQSLACFGAQLHRDPHYVHNLIELLRLRVGVKSISAIFEFVTVMFLSPHKQRKYNQSIGAGLS
jgi:hypothetical protein